MDGTGNSFDIFIIHAPEDKSFADRLAYFLIDAGLNIGHGTTIPEGCDNLAKAVNEGFSGADSGIVILSRSFFAKNTTEKIIAVLNNQPAGRSP